MKIEKEESEIFDSLSENEIDELLFNLKKYSVPLPDENMIDSSIDMMRQYVPHKKSILERLHENFINFIKCSTIQIAFMDKGYWFINMLIYIAGYFAINNFKVNPHLVIIALSPLPFILGVMDIVREKEGMYEIESVCKTSLSEAVLTKLLIVLAFNMILNVLITFMVGRFELISKATIVYLAPLTFMSGIVLYTVRKFRSNYAVFSIMVLWIFGMYLTVSVESIGKMVIRADDFFYTAVLLVGALNMAVQLKKFICDLSKESDFIEFNS